MVRLRDLPFPPLLVTLRLVLPVVGERLLERGVEGARELGGERLDAETLRKHGVRWRLVAELDRHLPEAAHFAVAAARQQGLRRGVRPEGHVVDSLGPERSEPFLAAIDQLRAETVSAPPVMDDTHRKAGTGLLLDPAERGDFVSFLEQPGVLREAGAREPGRDVRDTDTRLPSEQSRLVLGKERGDRRKVSRVRSGARSRWHEGVEALARARSRLR